MPKTKGPGRPRKDPRPRSHPPEEEILRAAGKLFAAKGFAGTSTRQIAEAAGLKQPALYHYYTSKEDLLRALSERALVRPLEALEGIAAVPGRPSAKLYLVVTFHVRHLCSEPFDLTAVMQDAFTLSRKRFRGWYQSVDRYTQGFGDLIEAGIKGREFVAPDARITALAMLGMCNWTLRWYRKGGRWSPDQIGDQFARLALRSLLREPSRLETIVGEARTLRASAPVAALFDIPG